MTATDQLKIIDNKIEANQAQYDLDRLAIKTSTYFSGDLEKYEYLTREGLRCKPSIFEQAKFGYSPLGKIFTEGFDKDDQKEGLLKGLENVKDKSKKLLNAFSAGNKVSKAAKNESDFNYCFKYVFYKFYKNIKKFKKISLGSQHDEMNDFYTLLIHSLIHTKQPLLKQKIVKIEL